MCGIFGSIGSDLSYEKAMKICNILKHRGPDDGDVWLDKKNKVCIGQRRLSIIDLSKRAGQPMKSKCGNFILTYNGEIYNYLLLRKKLQKSGYIFKSDSDTEVLLAGCLIWGVENTLKKLEGMFTFALYNIKEKSLWLARDPMGIKPLYYSILGNKIVFASELSPLLSFNWVSKSINKNSKYKFIWRLVETNTGKLICIDTQMANKVIYESLLKKKITELKKYDEIIPEPKVIDGSRLDFLLKSKGEKSCYIEVKSSTLSRIPNISEFPDSVTSRGSKHLSLLANLKNDGFRAIQIYLIQRNDTNCFKIAKDIDHQYFKTFQIAKKSGVEILILQSLISYDGIELSKKRL